MPGLLVLWRGWLASWVYLSKASMGAKAGGTWKEKTLRRRDEKEKEVLINRN